MKKITLLWCLILLATNSFAQTCNVFVSPNANQVISTTGTPTITSTVTVPTAGIVTDINVLNLTGLHTYMGDLTFTLTSPSGTTVTLIDAICGTDEDFDLELDDAGAAVIPCPATTGLAYQPDFPLSAFNGENPAGTWTLTVSDGASADGGNLVSWSLEVCASTVAPIDAGISLFVNPTDGLRTCTSNPIVPIVRLQNFGTTTLTSTTINYDIDGGANNTFNWVGNLVAGASIDVTLPAITGPTPGVFTVNASTNTPNGSADGNITNDSASAVTQFIQSTTFPYTEGFNGGAIPTNMIVSQSPNDGNPWTYNAASAYGIGTGSIRMDNFSVNTNNTFDFAFAPRLDLSAQTNAQLTFDVAYARYNALNSDTISVFVSTDCGDNYTLVYRKGGTDLSTAPDDTTAFTPTSTQWRNETVSLNAYAGNPNVLVLFYSEGNYGNNVYLDNINITSVAAPVDAGISSFTDPTNGVRICSNNPIAPTVRLQNYGTTPLTSTTINYDIDGGVNNTFNWTGNLAAGDSIDVTLPAITAPTPNVFTIYASTNMPNGNTDGNILNDSASTVSQLIQSATFPYSESFNGGAVPTNILISENPVDGNPWTYNTASAYGIGTGCISMDNFVTNTRNTLDFAFLPHLDFSGQTSVELTFDIAYASYTATISDTLSVFISTDCGNSYTMIYRKGGSDLATAPDTTNAFIPTATQWRNETISLAAYDGNPNVLILFYHEGNYANNMFLDNINVLSPVVCNIAPTATIVNPVSCNNGNDGAVSAAANNGLAPYTYSWSNGQNGATITNLTGGTYTVTVTDANSCTATTAITLVDPTAISSSLSVVDSVSCNNTNTGRIQATATGGTTGYTYALGTATQTTPTFSNLAAGTYTVTITDANGCITTTNSVTLSNPSVLIATATTTNIISCNGANDGTLTANASGGNSNSYTYSWSNGQNGATINNLMAGTYTVTITDANGCTAIYSETLTEPSPIISTINTVAAISCNGATDGILTASATGGNAASYTYNWSNGQNGATINNLMAGTYTVTVTDANGCTTTNSEILTEPSPIVTTINTIATISCNGGNNGALTVSATGGNATSYTYNWSNGLNGATIPNLTAGAYTVTVTDANGCTTTNSETLTEPTVVVPTISLVSPINCPNGSTGALSVTATGGNPNSYTYSWSNGQNGASIVNLMAGTYTVTATDASGCTATANYTLSDPTAILPTIIATSTISCNGGNNGALSASATGGNASNYTYLWSNGQAIDNISNLVAGTYSVTVTDANGCVATTSRTLNNPAPIVASATVTSQAGCSGSNTGAITAAATGGSTNNYTYLWSNGQATASISNLPAGTYTVTATDNGCSGTTSATISPAGNLTVNTTINSTIDCNGDATGSVTAAANGGNTANYTYAWSNGQATASISNLPAGTYTVTATNNGCTAVSTVTLSQPTLLTATANDNGDGSATVLPNGGTANYTYLWSDGQVNATAANLTNGTYTVTVTDANNCSTTASVTVIVSGLDNIANLSAFDILPNPNTGNFHVQIDLTTVQAGNVQVVNVLGQVLRTYNFEAQSVTLPIEIQEQTSGVYFVVLNTSNQTVTRKVTVSK